MAITPRHIPHLGTLVVAMLCTCAASGCRTLTIPWEHPAVFKKTPVCDSAGACNQGCYVPPPPVMNSDCYGYRFTCWSPWPEHCQPQCNEGCESPSVQSEPMPAALPPEMSPVAPMPPAETVPESPPAAPQSAFPSAGSRQTASRSSAPQYRSNYEEPQRSTTRYSTPSTAADKSSPTPDYRFLSAVAESPSTGDSSMRTTSDATRLDRGVGPEDQPSSASATSQHAVERFRW